MSRSMANPRCSQEEMRLVQALRLRLRRLQLELQEAHEVQAGAERQAEEYHVQGEALEEMRRCHMQEAQRLARQRRLEMRHQASLRAQLHEVQQAIGRCRSDSELAGSEVPSQAHSALQRRLSEAKEQLHELRGDNLRLQEELREAQQAPPPKTQDLPRPAWVGDRPQRRKDSCLGSPRTPSADGSMLSRQVGATETLRGELGQLQDTLTRELRRQKALQRREEILQKRQRQLEAALKQSRAEQAAELNSLHAELQEGARHVQRLLDFAMHAPGVAVLQSLASDAGNLQTPTRRQEAWFLPRNKWNTFASFQVNAAAPMPATSLTALHTEPAQGHAVHDAPASFAYNVPNTGHMPPAAPPAPPMRHATHKEIQLGLECPYFLAGKTHEFNESVNSPKEDATPREDRPGPTGVRAQCGPCAAADAGRWLYPFFWSRRNSAADALDATVPQLAQLRGGIVARQAYRPKLIRAVSKSLQKTAGNTLRPGERAVELPALSEKRRQEATALIGDFDRLYPTVALKQHEMRAEYQAHFRPHASSQAWEEMDPMSFAQLLSAEELPIEGFVDVGSGLGKLVVMASSITTAPCWGVELSPARAAAAAEGLKRLQGAQGRRKGEVRLVQGNCLRDLPREVLERASHFLLTMRRVGKLPAGTRQVAERFLDLLAATPGPTRIVWSVRHKRAALVMMCSSFSCYETSGAVSNNDRRKGIGRDMLLVLGRKEVLQVWVKS
eukprot:s824_g5.t2